MRRVVTLLTVVLLNSTGGALAQQIEKIYDKELYNLLQSATDLLKQNKLEAACEKFRQALAHDPQSTSAVVGLGATLLKLGKSEEAQEVLLKATKNHPDAAEAWLNLGTSYQATGKITESLACLHEFLKLAPHHELVPKVQSMITLLQQDQQRRAKMTGNDQGDDYLADAAQSGTVRFAKERMPIKIYLYPATSVPGYKPEYEQIVRRAFVDWQAAAPDFLSFMYVPSAEAADITVTWTNDATKMVSSAEGGHAMVIPAPSGIVKSDITLLTTQASSQGELGLNQARHIVLHEIGHALGILGHSPKAGDIMYGVVIPTDLISNLSDRDKHTMLALYSAKGTDYHALDKSHLYSQGDANSPGSKMVRLNNEAGEAMKAGHYSEAQDKFEQALKLDPNNFGLKQNLGALYTNLGNVSYMKRDFAGAESYFQKAIPILQQSPDKSNLKLLLRNYFIVLKMSGKVAEANKIEAQLNAIK